MTGPAVDPLSWCRPGAERRRSFTVAERHTASALGGDLAVVGTPVLICWAEVVASDLLRELSGGLWSSAGARVNVDHRGSAEVGEPVEVAVLIVSRVLHMARFAVTAVHGRTGATVLQGEHDRVVVARSSTGPGRGGAG